MNMSGYLTIFGSMLIAMLLMIMPLPETLSAIWPLWIVVVMAYWMVALPHRVGLWSAWVIGLWLDVFNNTLFGQHALALVIVAYLIDKLHRPLRLWNWWQQSIVITCLSALYGVILYSVQCFLRETTLSWQHWLPVLSSGLVWPLVFWLLRHYRQKYRIT